MPTKFYKLCDVKTIILHINAQGIAMWYIDTVLDSYFQKINSTPTHLIFTPMEACIYIVGSKSRQN